jgi:predicted small lipoprotein YifL
MKKVFLFAVMAAMLLSFTACGANDPTFNTSSSSSSASQSASSQSGSSAVSSSSTSSTLDMGRVEDNLKGLEEYLISAGVVQGTPTDMAAEFIGAKSGAKYSYTYEGKNVIVELYEFEPSNLNETAKKTIDSVKKNGKFTILNQEVPAVLSDSEKYLMIYTDKATEQKNVAHKTESEKTFKLFKK